MNLLAFGSNAKGQLGIGSEQDSATPVQCLHVSGSHSVPISSLDIKKVTGGGNHSAILTSIGDLWMSGDSSCHQCGGDISNTRFTLKSFLNGAARWMDVACGWTSTILVSHAGDVYAMGRSVHGELGLGPETFSTDTPTLVRGVDCVVRVACGLRHVVVLREDGSVWGWGSGRHGELGGIDEKDRRQYAESASLKQPGKRNHHPVWRPICIHPATPPIASIACGEGLTVLLTVTGNCLTMGQNKHGQLGRAHPDTCMSSAVLDRVPGLPSRVCEVSVGWHHVVVMLDTGEAWAWGRGDHGQLGTRRTAEEWAGDHVAIAFRPVKVAVEGRVAWVACGSEHVIAGVEKGAVVAWGWNEHGNCGGGADGADVWVPRVVEGVSGVMVGAGAGCGSSWVWTTRE
ncbi:regulator of chromosome condensation 1/beta-lactamase-inhibitor protein II [Jimgerdemannia flammicorona]|uniref:Regulator of chromosome condensation 1/beta-lactamase-inhibitor protein II n=1 Tax=Jimgerdemannia flammicorona TaxID=994334 RepID=A0A433QJU3_9FUNG|nr:regulator of chromosome condensation 1/beta-lactamase-inhibitor protein II [Jimgerdemannia flammicorona]